MNDHTIKWQVAEAHRSDEAAAFQLSFRRNPVALAIHDQNTLAYIEVNESAVAIYGWPYETFLEKSVLDVVPPLEHEAAIRHFRTGDLSLLNGTWENVIASGETIFVEVVVQEIVWRGRAAILSAIVDVTQKIAAIDALERSEQALERLLTERTATLDALPAQILLIDDTGQIVSVNRAWRESAATNGYTAEHHGIGINYIKICEAQTGLFADGAQTFAQGIRSILGGKADNFELTYPCQVETEERWFRCTVTPMVPGAKKTGAVVMHIDITTSKRAEEAINAARLAAEEASRLKSQFLANTSHELRTPLNAIIGFSEIMVRELFGTLSPRYHEYAGDILRSGKLLLNLIGDLLDLSKIEAGRLELDDGEVEVHEIVAQCVTLVADRAAQGKIRIETAIPRSLILIADRLRLKQVFLNLMSNAVKFTPPGGQIKVSAEILPDRSVLLIVADTGIGMTEDGKLLAVQPFVQLDGAINRKAEGTGLGLALAVNLVSLHGGVLTIESELGKGTAVLIRLPPERNRNMPKNLSLS